MIKYFFFFTILCTNLYAQTLMVSHKGVWKDHIYPQNSLQSLTKAKENGFNGIEFDIYKTKDYKFVLAHDDSIKKLSNCKRPISQMELSETKNCIIGKNTLLPITQLLLKKVKSPQRITSLYEVRDKLFYDDAIQFIWIDLKDQTDDIILSVEEFILSINDQKVLDKIVINNGNPELLLKLKSLLPQIKFSLEGKWGSEPLTDKRKYIDNIGITHDYISLNTGIYLGHEPIYKLIGRKRRFWNYLESFLNEAQSKDIPIIGWTVNRRKKINKLRNMGIDFLLTDSVKP